MTHKTEFATADFVILKVVKKMENKKFFKKREFFLPWQKYSDTNQQFSNFPYHLHWHLLYADTNCKGGLDKATTS